MADINVITIKNNSYRLYDQTALNMGNSANSEYNQAVNNLDSDLDEDYTYLGIYNDDINVLENRLEALENNVANLLEDMMYENQYFTIEHKTSRSLKIIWPKNTTTSNHKTIYWSRNKSKWEAISSNKTNTINFSSAYAKTLYFKGTNDSYEGLGITASGSGTFKVYGNIMSLFYGDNFKGQTAFPNSNANNILDSFFGDDNNSTNYLIDASNLILPATTLTNACYGGMFMKCTRLETAPELPATTLAELCYADMFNGCTSLVNAPKLPATVLAESCYIEMFKDCTSLTTAPELPATILTEACYQWMFDGCDSLTTAPKLPATILAPNCYECMFNDCTSLITAPSILPATTLAESCYYEMFYGCTSLTTAPTLYGTILAPDCYGNMFRDCTSLNYIKYYGNLSSYTNGDNQFSNWVNSVASSGIFENPNNINFPENSAIGIPSGWSHIHPWGGLTIECTKGPLQLDWGMNSYTEAYAKIIEYSTDGINWTSITSCDSSVSYPDSTSLHGRFPILNVGDKLYLRGNNLTYSMPNVNNSQSKIIQPAVVMIDYSIDVNGSPIYRWDNNDGEYNVYGNIMSLIDKDNYFSLTTLSTNGYDTYTYIGTFYKMFADTNVVNASGLMLPATTLTVGCYGYMFKGCTLLTATPELPATTLTPACYYGMFSGCTSLTIAPELPATTLAADCYHDMFYGCTSLNYVKYSGTAGWSNYNGEFEYWLYNVAYNGTFVNPNNIDFPRNDNGIPSSWTIITS